MRRASAFASRDPAAVAIEEKRRAERDLDPVADAETRGFAGFQRAKRPERRRKIVDRLAPVRLEIVDRRGDPGLAEPHGLRADAERDLAAGRRRRTAA